MKRNIRILFAGVLLVTAAGCTGTGLSVRERGGLNYSNMIYGLYGNDNERPAEKKDLVTPVTLAVAQVGEASPSQDLLEEFKRQGALIARVIPLPLGGEEASTPGYYGQNNNANVKEEDLEKKMAKVRSLARDLGADYLFLFGGTMDYGATPNLLQVFDLTIVGAYLFPSTKHEIEGKTSGALIDVADGRVVFIAEAQSRLARTTPSYMNYYSGNDQLAKEVRDDLVRKLTQAFLEELKIRAGALARKN